jgi:predicted O-methyltransferase YrrM
MPNKTCLVDYVSALAKRDCVLRKGGLILVNNNVLWKGVVLDLARSGNNSGWYDELRQRRQ